ncbi:DedA family protein, partial [Streptomyces albiflaviniger]|nr:DedA family protein [Streptomyces albiflaviniger]
YWLGDQWDEVETYVGVLSKVVLAAVVVAIVVYVVMRFRGRDRRHHAS